MSKININEYIKETLKLKGNISVKSKTAESLALLEKQGLQVNLLIAGLLDDLDYESLIVDNDETIEEEKKETNE